MFMIRYGTVYLSCRVLTFGNEFVVLLSTRGQLCQYFLVDGFIVMYVVLFHLRNLFISFAFAIETILFMDGLGIPVSREISSVE